MHQSGMSTSFDISEHATQDETKLSAMLGLQPLDYHLTALLQRMDPGMSSILELAVKTLSARTREGHICLDLAGRDGVWPKVVRLAGMEGGLDVWRRDIAASPMVGQQMDEIRPLMLMGNRLYLRRYFRAETAVAEGLLKRAGENAAVPDPAFLKKTLDRFFPAEDDDGISLQKVAAFAAARKRLAVIVGGPGTGKTTTVCRLLASLCSLADRVPEVVLAAPTGKAAGRLCESMLAGKRVLEPVNDGMAGAIPETASTLHRLLGLVHGRRARYHKGNPLSADVVVVDEVSMVDIFLMAKLMDALKPGARLILLGDRYQLASVLPGAVLGEICKQASWERSIDFIENARDVLGTDLPFTSRSGVPAMADCVVELTRSWRFDAAGGIGRLARGLNEGRSADVLSLLEGGEDPSCGWYSVTGAGDREAVLMDVIQDGFSGLVAARTPEQAFAALESFRILCVLREGPSGVGGMNGMVEKILERTGHIRLAGPWYAGRPVMVLRNDAATGLYNGDVGFTMQEEKSGDLQVVFPAEGGGFRSFHPLRLPDVETVFAMTVHKSQGSEFDRVLLILPERDAPVLTREILYTAVTRARKEIRIAGDRNILSMGMGRSVNRSSGLGDMIWKSKTV